MEWTTSGNDDLYLDVLTGLQPHVKLKKLIITNYCGYSFLLWLSDRQSCMLKVVHLRKCQGCKALPPLRELRFLEDLVIESMSSLRTIHPDFVGVGGSVVFRSLKSLTFINMPILSKWECLGDLHMPQLRLLKFDSCPMLMNLPPLHGLSSFQIIEILGCETLGLLPYLPGNLVSIKTLTIRNSPILKARYQVDGTDWRKVRTVPMVQIDEEKMPTTS